MTSSPIAIGLMSGTSADGISAAVGSFKEHTYKLITHLTVPYPADVLPKIRAGGSLSTAELSALNMRLGELFADAANRALKKAHLRPDQVACIGSHGQTIYHGPKDAVPNTLQIAEPAVIAERTGIAVVSNFRQRDIAAGGEGAPLIPFFDQYFFGSGPARALLNIGGIANVTIVGRDVKEPLAFDTGPGNSLMDAAVRELTQGAESYDHHGQRAKRGTLDMAVIGRMIANDYFRRPPPKSTGPELFGINFLREHLGEMLASRPDDALATLNYFTCLTIQESFRHFVFGKFSISEIIVSGGGVHNKTMMKKLECLFAPVEIKSITAYDLPAEAKEPLAFAFFGLRCLHNQTNHQPSGTGAKHARVLGSITRGH